MNKLKKAFSLMLVGVFAIAGSMCLTACKIQMKDEDKEAVETPLPEVEIYQRVQAVRDAFCQKDVLSNDTIEITYVDEVFSDPDEREWNTILIKGYDSYSEGEVDNAYEEEYRWLDGDYGYVYYKRGSTEWKHQYSAKKFMAKYYVEFNMLKILAAEEDVVETIHSINEDGNYCAVVKTYWEDDKETAEHTITAIFNDTEIISYENEYRFTWVSDGEEYIMQGKTTHTFKYSPEIEFVVPEEIEDMAVTPLTQGEIDDEVSNISQKFRNLVPLSNETIEVIMISEDENDEEKTTLYKGYDYCIISNGYAVYAWVEGDYGYVYNEQEGIKKQYSLSDYLANIWDNGANCFIYCDEHVEKGINYSIDEDDNYHAVYLLNNTETETIIFNETEIIKSIYVKKTYREGEFVVIATITRTYNYAPETELIIPQDIKDMAITPTVED